MSVISDVQADSFPDTSSFYFYPGQLRCSFQEQPDSPLYPASAETSVLRQVLKDSVVDSDYSL